MEEDWLADWADCWPTSAPRERLSWASLGRVSAPKSCRSGSLTTKLLGVVAGGGRGFESRRGRRSSLFARQHRRRHVHVEQRRAVGPVRDRVHGDDPVVVDEEEVGAGPLDAAAG